MNDFVVDKFMNNFWKKQKNLGIN